MVLLDYKNYWCSRTLVLAGPVSPSVGDKGDHRASYSDAHDEIQQFILFFADLPGEPCRDRSHADKCQHHMGATHPVSFKAGLNSANALRRGRTMNAVYVAVA